MDVLLEKAGIDEFATTYPVAIRGKDAKGSKGAIFYGDPQIFVDEKVITQKVTLPQGYWELATPTGENQKLLRPSA